MSESAPESVPVPPPEARRNAARVQPKPSTAYFLGQFFGHIVQAIKGDVSKPPEPAERSMKTVRTKVDEAVVETKAGPVTLRRTTIDEVRAK